MSPGEGARRAGNKEGNVGSEATCNVEQFGPRYRLAGERVGGEQRAGGVTRPAAESRTRRNPLVQCDANAKASTGCLEHRIGGAPCQVLFRGPDVRTLHVERDATLGSRDIDRVGQRNAAEEGLDPVISVVLARQNAKEEIDLRRALASDVVGHVVAVIAPRMAIRVRQAEYAPSAVMGNQVRTW